MVKMGGVNYFFYFCKNFLDGNMRTKELPHIYHALYNN